MTDINTIPGSPAVDTMEVAYNASLADILAVPESELIPITLESVRIATSMQGILPRLVALRDEIAATWQKFDFERFDKLQQYCLALVHAHALYNGSSTPKRSMIDTATQLTEIRDEMYAVALPLVRKGLMDRSELEKCKVATGYRPLMGDVVTLAELFKKNWSALQGKVPFTLEELVRAKNLTVELMNQLGLKEHSPVALAEAAVIRQRAFSLFVNTYEDARRAVVYLRGKAGDADDIAPSFYALRHLKRPTAEEAPEPHPAESTPAAAPPSPTLPSQHFQNPTTLPLDNPFTN